MAALLNLVVGTLPLSIPALLEQSGYLDSRTLSAAIVASLAAAQLLFVHRTGASPGYAMLCLEICRIDGAPLTWRNTLTRAAPYLIILISLLTARLVDHIYTKAVLGWAVLICLLTVLLSTAFALFTARSLIDRMSGTRVVAPQKKVELVRH